MEITLIGTGTPMPYPGRGGTAILLRTSDRKILIDCGPNAVYRLMEEGVNIGEIYDVLFTHHHIDHNSDFLTFWWLVGHWVGTISPYTGQLELRNYSIRFIKYIARTWNTGPS